jgi:hypothetical protein
MRGRIQEIVWRRLAAGAVRRFSPGRSSLHSFLIFSSQSRSASSLMRERAPFQMALSFEREM